jgi:integrase/recombinase XerD
MCSVSQTRRNTGRDRGLIVSNKARTAVPRTLTPTDVCAVLDELDARYQSNRCTRAAVALMYGCGLRVGEAVALTADAIDYEQGCVTVPYVPGLTKTGGRRVALPTSPRLLDVLQEWDRSRSREADTYLHTSRCERVATSHVRRRLSQVTERIGLDGVHPHTLRHSYARLLLANGVPVNVLQSALGHADLSTTTVYTRLDESEQVRVLQALPALV